MVRGRQMFFGFRWIVIIAFSLSSSGCLRGPGNPVSVVGDYQTSLAIRAFLDSSARLALAYGYGNANVQNNAVSAGAKRILIGSNDKPFVLSGFDCTPGVTKHDGVCSPPIVLPSGATVQTSYSLTNKVSDQSSLIRDYVNSGWIASRMMCRNYLGGLSERNDLFEFLKKQFNITGGLAHLGLEVAKASSRSIAFAGAAQSFITATIDNFAEFSFLTPDQATMQDLVEKAQNALSRYYLEGGGQPKSFSEAINAVHNIEYQCTRSGLRHLIARSLAGTTIEANPKTGVLDFSGEVAKYQKLRSWLSVKMNLRGQK
jgi:hypothetical protein